MKVLIFSVAYTPFVGGAEVAVKEITDRISDIEFHMLTVNLDGRQKKYEQIGNVHVHRVGGAFCRGMVGKLAFPFLGALRARSLHRMHRFDTTWSIMANYAGFAALFFSYIKPQVPFLLTLQEGDPIPYIKRQVWFVYPLFQQIFRRASRVQAISNYLADFARDMGARGEISVIPNGVDFELFSKPADPARIADLRQKFVFTADDIVLVTASRLVQKNGIEDVINALPRLPDSYKFLIAGVGPLEKQLRARVRAISVSSRVVFAGFVPHADLPAYFQMSHVFVRPSLSEGMGNAFIEAMAACLPVVATSVGGIADFLEDNVTGFVCRVQNSESVADRVRASVEQKEIREKVIENGTRLARDTYNWNIIARNMKTFLNLSQK
jgi:glycosyltransferase involved in cell wall biosynthesis